MPRLWQNQPVLGKKKLSWGAKLSDRDDITLSQSHRSSECIMVWF